jgi:ketosteroid isomerase-like protein
MLLAGVGFTFACRSPRPEVAVTPAVFDSLLAVHSRHAVAEDLEAVINGYTEDAVVRSNHMEPLRGRPALRTFFTNLFAAVDVRSLNYKTEKLSVHGDTAWIVATYDLGVQAPNAPVQTDRGSAFALWLRDSAGVWRIHDDIVNSSMPIPAAGQIEKQAVPRR